ncbi:MAG: Ig-like domain-containing protein [Acutalibacteraceae bacterium]|nr:Ig-like domain-containing protein [Acutalibacteraceae bacterium]
MASKNVLKYGTDYVPTINDNTDSEFGKYETYSREKIDEKIDSGVGSSTGYDWSNKLVVFEGESITMNATMKYPERVGEQTGCEVLKIGIAGVPVMGVYPGRDIDLRRRIANIPANADAILILGDCNAIDTKDTQTDSTSLEEWGGRWNIAVEAIKKSFPTVPLFLISEYPMKGKKNQNKNVPIQFKAMAQKHGAIFICLAEESPISLIHAYPTWGLTATDGVHCNHEATMVWADVIANKLKDVKPTEWTGTDTIAIAETEVTVAVDSTVELTVTRTGDLSVQWTSDNMDVACVIGGVIYGMTEGTATITATTRNGNKATCTVTVTAA